MKNDIDETLIKLCESKYEKHSNENLATLLLNDIWAFEDLGSDKAQLIEVIIDRLKELK